MAEYSAASDKAPVTSNEPYKMGTREEEIVGSIIQDFSVRQLGRNTFAGQWEEVAELIDPTSRNTFFYGNFNWPGQKKTDRQVDASGMLALNRFTAICDSLLTPRNMFWHGLNAEGQWDYLMKDRNVRLYYEQVTKLLFQLRYMPIANFAGQNQRCYRGLGAYGTQGLFIDQAVDELNNPIRAFRYKAIPLGEMFIAENHQGLVNDFIRWFRLTPRQAWQKWGKAIPDNLLEAMKQHSEMPFDFLHCVKPNNEYDPEAFDTRGKLFSSHYVSLQGRCILSEGGYRRFPMAVSRYDQAPGEMYGQSPAMAVLPALKTLNAQKRTFLKQAHRAADPVLLTADDGLVDGVSLRPGSLNKGGVTSDGKPLVQVLPTGQIQVAKEMMDEEKSLINDSFLVSLFQIMTETPQMTATEVIERVNEKGILIAPTMGRQQSEYLGSMIEREIDLASDLHLLPPMPPALREAMGHYDVAYTSPLAKSMRAQQVAGFQRTLETAVSVVNATQDPSVLDRFDFDTIIPEVGDIQGMPEHWIASDDQVAQKRKQRAAAQQQQAQIQAAPAQAAMMKAQAVQKQAGIAPPDQGQQQPPQGQGQ